MADGSPFAIFAGAGDAALTTQLLKAAGIEARFLADAADLIAAVGDPELGGIILDDDMLRGVERAPLIAALAGQPPWSDVPFIVVRPARRGGAAWWHGLDRANVTVLERPLKRSTMDAAVRAAARARARQHEVRDLLRRLQDENRLKDQFIAMLGHELRNPLSVIASAAQMLGLNTAKTGRYRELIQRQVGHLTRIVDDLLDISRMMHGKLSIERKPVDVCDVVRRCVEECGPAIARRGQRLRTELPDRPLYVSGDTVRLEQVLSNLVTNATRYTPENGEIAVVAEHRRQPGRGGTAIVRVRDNGIGIPAALMPHLFELFVQGDQTLARTHGGLGMGLALVKNIVELHGGTVTVSSAGEGQGAEFVVILPAMVAAPAVMEEELAPVRPRSLRIVLVEDNPDTRESLEDFLKLEGHTVNSSGDGRDGAELIVSARPDVAVVDIGLPTIDGYQVARYVRSCLHAGVRLLALTGYGQPQDRQMAMDAGFDAHMVKPIDPPDLARALAFLTASEGPIPRFGFDRRHPAGGHLDGG
jgi:signal transduction histidine kinase/CheY-like chemotaxis protein